MIWSKEEKGQTDDKSPPSEHIVDFKENKVKQTFLSKGSSQKILSKYSFLGITVLPSFQVFKFLFI